MLDVSSAADVAGDAENDCWEGPFDSWATVASLYDTPERQWLIAGLGAAVAGELDWDSC